MKFVAGRELRIRPGAVWDLLRQEQDLVITANGKPVAILTRVGEADLEGVLAVLRQSRAREAVAHLRRETLHRGLTGVPDREVKAIVGRSRRARRRKAASTAR